MIDREKIASEFYIEDHALIFALMAEYAEKEASQKGLDATEKAVVRYGRERGLRMAMRAQEDNQELSPNNYFVYCEWQDYKKYGRSETVSVTPEYVTKCTACGWCDTWQKYNLTKYGKIYCRLIDKSLVKGFNPENELEVDGALSMGDKYCGFHWKGADFSDKNTSSEINVRKSAISYRTVKDFLYHTGHILGTMSREYYAELGIIKSQLIIKEALDEYERIYGKEKREALVCEAKQDFLKI